jgi:hypothetical protein
MLDHARSHTSVARTFGRAGAWSDALTCYYLTSALVALGVLVGYSLLSPARPIPYGENDYWQRFAAWDGGQFMQIIEHGYQYDPKRISNVALFPALPVLAKGIVRITGCSPAIALLVISHAFLAMSFVVLSCYVRERFPGRPELPAWTALAFGLFPVTFYFRMAYSESMFIFLALLTFYGMERRWPIPLLAVIAGTSTAARLVGVALAVPLIIHTFRREKDNIDRISQLAMALPLCAWGVAAYMFFLWQRFDDPLVFIKAQENFLLRPNIILSDRLLHLFSGEPLWATYIPSSSAYWRNFSSEPSAWLNMQFANPIYFVLAVVTVAAGRYKNILNLEETTLADLLLAIPYLSRGYEFCMGSQACYSAAAFPLYLVWGVFLSRLPLSISGSLLGLWGFLLAMYAGLFASWYFFV